MNNLDFIARLAKDGFYNPNCEDFGGSNKLNLFTKTRTFSLNQ